MSYPFSFRPSCRGRPSAWSPSVPRNRTGLPPVTSQLPATALALGEVAVRLLLIVVAVAAAARASACPETGRLACCSTSGCFQNFLFDEPGKRCQSDGLISSLKVRSLYAANQLQPATDCCISAVRCDIFYHCIDAVHWINCRLLHPVLIGLNYKDTLK